MKRAWRIYRIYLRTQLTFILSVFQNSCILNEIQRRCLQGSVITSPRSFRPSFDNIFHSSYGPHLRDGCFTLPGTGDRSFLTNRSLQGFHSPSYFKPPSSKSETCRTAPHFRKRPTSAGTQTAGFGIFQNARRSPRITRGLGTAIDLHNSWDVHRNYPEDAHLCVLSTISTRKHFLRENAMFSPGAMVKLRTEY